MKQFKSSILMKTISYILVPILTLNILIHSFSLLYYEEYAEDIELNTTYFETEQFVEDFFSRIFWVVYDINIDIKNEIIIAENNLDENSQNEDISDIELEKSNYAENIYYQYDSDTYSMYNYLIIDENGMAYTNIKKTVYTDTIEELIKYVQEKQYFWIYENNEVKTSISKMEYNNIAYNSYYESIEEYGYKIYACVGNEDSNEFYKYNLIYKLVSNTYNQAPANIALSGILLILVCIYIISSIGHKKDQDEIYTNSLDDIPLEIIGVISAILLFIEMFIAKIIISEIFSVNSVSNNMIDSLLWLTVLIGMITYLTIAITGITVIRRIKAKKFWKNTIMYKLINWVKRNTTDIIFSNINSAGKLFIFLLVFVILQFIFWNIAINESGWFIIAIIVMYYIVYKKILEKINSLNKIREKIKNMYNGNVDFKLNEEEFTGNIKQIARELNDISGGLSNAIDEAMKSERLKTELITNVSHDIKTPLTSIINYIDLIKKEDINNEKVKEYLEVLDSKSQRLKKLTEDLVEASKASSGNIKLNMEKLNVKELVKQVSGEFEDKFEERGLKLIENLPQKELYIEADSRYMFRVLENLYVNISKYASENSRVYIDIECEKDTVKLILKNISQDKLNISVDELMQRFMRGDSARTTEGSGLGISIASSLTKLQKGKFNIYLDGDLFKVILEFKTI